MKRISRFAGINFRYYLICQLVILASMVALICVDQGRNSPILTVADKVLQKTTPGFERELTVGHMPDAIRFETSFKSTHAWGLIKKNDYALDISEYDALKVTVRVSAKNEALKIGFRTHKSLENCWVANTEDPPGIMWVSSILIQTPDVNVTATLPFHEFRAYEFDPVIRDCYRDVWTRPYSKSAALQNHRITLREVFIQPYSDMVGRRTFDIIGIQLVREPFLHGWLIVVMFLCGTLIPYAIFMTIERLAFSPDNEDVHSIRLEQCVVEKTKGRNKIQESSFKIVIMPANHRHEFIPTTNVVKPMMMLAAIARVGGSHGEFVDIKDVLREMKDISESESVNSSHIANARKRCSRLNQAFSAFLRNIDGVNPKSLIVFNNQRVRVTVFVEIG